MRYIEQLQKNAGRDSATISELMKENAELRHEIQSLRLELLIAHGEDE